MNTATARRIRRVVKLHAHHRALITKLAKSDMPMAEAMKFGSVFTDAARHELSRRDFDLYLYINQRSAMAAKRRLINKLATMRLPRRDSENN